MRVILFICLYQFFSFYGISQEVLREIEEKQNTPASALQRSQTNLYFTKRNQYLDRNTKTLTASEQKELDGIVEGVGSIAPASFEFNYLYYVNEKDKTKAFSYLQRAAEIYPDNKEITESFIHYYELTNDEANKKKYCQKLYESNTIDPGVMEYNYNVLMSMPSNSVLITYGDDDTNPVFIWQEIKSTRKDIDIIHIDMLNDPLYRQKKSEQLGLKIKPQSNSIETAKWLIKNNPSKEIYLGNTVSPSLLSKLKENLYLTGLTYKYAEEKINNINLLKDNYENKFSIEILQQKTTNALVRKLNMNYILPLITILEIYTADGQKTKAKATRNIILKIAQEGGKQDEIVNYIELKGL